MTVIRELFARLGVQADTAQVERFDAAVDRVKSGLKAAATAATALGAATAAAFAAMVSETSQSALEIQSVADRFELSTDKVQELGSIARGAGMELEDFADVINTINERAQDSFLDPKSDPGQTLRRLGIDAVDANGKLKSSEEILFEMSDAFARIENPAQRSAEASILLGDVGVKLLPVLKEGSAGLREMGAAAQATGVVMSEAALKDLGEFRKQQHQLAEVTRGLRQRLALLAIKALRPLGELLIKRVVPAVQRLIDRLEAWFKDTDRVNKILARLKVAARVAAAAVAVIVAGKVIAMTGAFAATILQLVKGFVLLRKAAGLAAVKVLIIPAAIALLALLVEDLFTFLSGGDSLIGRFVDRFAETEGPLGDIARAILNAKPLLQDLFAAAMRIGKQMMAAALRVVPVIMRVVAELLPIIEELATEALAFAKEVIDELLPIVVELIPVVKDLARQIMDAVKAIVPVVIPIIKSMIAATRAIIPVVLLIIKIVVGVINAVMPILVPLIQRITAIVVRLVKFIGSVIERIAAFITQLVSWVKPKAEAGLKWWTETAQPAIKDFLSKVESFFKEAFAAVKKFIDPIISAVDGVIENVAKLTDIDVPGIGDLIGGESTAGGVAAAARQALAAQQNNTNNVGAVQVTIEGSTSMGPGEVAQATAQGTRSGLEEAQRAAGRDVSVG